MKGGEIFIPKMPSMKVIDLARAICPDCKQEVIGIRPGEKLHETLVPADDGIHTYEYNDKFITYPYVVDHKKKGDGGNPLNVNFDGYRSERLPANLLQAQRDYFGAHTYERIDKPKGEFFHTNWTGRGGDVTSRTYNV